MNRKEYMEQLSKVLERVDPEVARDILEDYEAHFERAKESGRSEEEIIEELGSIEEFAAELDSFADKERGEKKAEHTKSDLAGVVQDIVNAAANGMSQVTGALDKVFSGNGGFGEWFSSFEKSGESGEDYRRRQESARPEQNVQSEQNAGANSNYRFSAEENEEEQYMPESSGSVEQQEGIRNVEIDSKMADVVIMRSEDNTFRYRYVNSGSTGSKIVYHLNRRTANGTLYLSVAKDVQVHIRTHFSILGSVFDMDSSLRLEIYVPEWIEGLSVNGSSGDVEIKNAAVRTVKLKSMSGDIRIADVVADKCMAESSSGDVNVENSSFSYVLGTSKSGDVNAENVKAAKGAFRTMSGDATVRDAQIAENSVSSMSGDASVFNLCGELLRVESMSGDARAENIQGRDAAISAVSGDVKVNMLHAESAKITGNSGDIDANKVETAHLMVSAVSGDMSVRGSSGKMDIRNGSGDVIVIQNGDTRAAVSTRSGDVHYHLKNDGNGFAAKLSTHGGIDFRYKDLIMSDAANGIHRYGAEGSSVEISSTSGDITLLD